MLVSEIEGMQVHALPVSRGGWRMGSPSRDRGLYIRGFAED